MGNVIDEEGHIIYPNQLRLNKQPTTGDDFDISGNPEQSDSPSGVNLTQGMTGALLMGLLANPGNMFGGISPHQVENIKALIVGGGTGGVYKILNKHLGTKASAVIGSLLAAYIADKLIKE